MKQKFTELNGEIDSSTIIVGDFNTLLAIMNTITRQKITKETEDMNNTINKLDLTDIYRTLYPLQQNTHPSQVYMGHIPG